MPMVPPAPATFVTWIELASPAACSAWPTERAVWSHPPPGAAGAMIFKAGACARAPGAMPGRHSSDAATMALANFMLFPPPVEACEPECPRRGKLLRELPPPGAEMRRDAPPVGRYRGGRRRQRGAVRGAR